MDPPLILPATHLRGQVNAARAGDAARPAQRAGVQQLVQLPSLREGRRAAAGALHVAASLRRQVGITVWRTHAQRHQPAPATHHSPSLAPPGPAAPNPAHPFTHTTSPSTLQLLWSFLYTGKDCHPLHAAPTCCASSRSATRPGRSSRVWYWGCRKATWFIRSSTLPLAADPVSSRRYLRQAVDVYGVWVGKWVGGVGWRWEGGGMEWAKGAATWRTGPAGPTLPQQQA